MTVPDVELRDYLAAKAMVGLLTHVNSAKDDFIAKRAYQMADAMLKEREKRIPCR